jgi:hypothetical protein
VRGRPRSQAPNPGSSLVLIRMTGLQTAELLQRSKPLRSRQWVEVPHAVFESRLPWSK